MIEWRKGTLIFFCLVTARFSVASTSTSDTLTPLVSFIHFGEEEGLFCKTIYEAIQDKDGFMWFGTDAGAFRYDGKFFKRFGIEDGLTDNEVLKICQDHLGRVWFLTLNGHLSFWHKGKIYNPGNTAFLKEAYTGGSIYSHFEDSHGRLWLGTSKFGFIIIEGDSAKTINYTREEYSIIYATMGIMYIHEDSDGLTWTFGKKDMSRFPENDASIPVPLPGNASVYIVCRGKKNSEVFYITLEGNSSGRIYKVLDKTISLFADKAEIQTDSKIINMTSDGDYVWVCTQGSGCNEIRNGKFSKKYFENIAITNVFRDRESNLWFSTMGEGIYLLPSNMEDVKNYNQSSGLLTDNVTAVAIGSNDDLWLGYNNGVVEKISDNSKTTFKLNRSFDPKFNRVIGLTTDSNATLCGTDVGIFYIYKNKVRFVSEGKQKKNSGNFPVKRLVKDIKNNIYATHPVGFSQVLRDNEGYVLKNIIDPPIRTFSVTEYPDNHLLISTSNGLMEYIEGKGSSHVKTDIDFSSMRVFDMKVDADNLLLLATNGNGIYILKDKKLYQHLSTANGLSDDNCKRICISGDSMYVSTDNGLNVLVKQNHSWNISEVITTKNGLLSNTVNDAVINSGKIYLATEKGLSIINQSVVNRDKFVGKVYVTEIITDSVQSLTDTSYIFNAGIPRLLVRFAYPVFNPSNDLRISYRLLQKENDNPGWINSGNNEMEFSALSPGNYILQLKPDVQSRVAAITNFYFEIIPLWWQTVAAKIIFGLLLLILVAMILRRRIQRQYEIKLEQLKLIDAERIRIASDMHDDIGADLTQITIWSNIIKSSGHNNNEDALNRIAKSSDEVLQKMEQIIWALNSTHNHSGDLISYLREFSIQYLDSAGIRLSFEVDAAVPDFRISSIFKRNIFLTVKELLHNTVKHSKAQNVSIKIYAAELLLHIEYRDDGKGFNFDENEKGLGTLTTQKRMREINSSVEMKSKAGEGFSAHLKIKLHEGLLSEL